MKRIIYSVLALLLICLPVQANENDPYELVKIVNKKVFNRLDTEQDLVKKDVEHLRTIIDEELMPYVDYAYAAYKVIGSNLKDTTKDQRDRFVVAFRDSLVKTFAQVLGYYTDQKLSFEPGGSFEGRSVVSSRMVIIDGDRPPIKVDFKLRKSKSSDTWKAFDMIAEGISVLSTKQSELGPLIRKDGIDAVIEDLQKVSASPLVINQRS